jgi:hypothetical protein
MTWTAEKVFVYPNAEMPEEYVFVDTSKSTYFTLIARSGFSAVSFDPAAPKGMEYNYPVVLDDFTITSKFIPMTEIAYADVPAKIKRRFTKWAKYQ